jgi:hypothetical protein
MEKKIKIYRAPISRVFPATHPRAGEYTYFKDGIRTALKNAPLRNIPISCSNYVKIHTIRAVNPESKSKNWFEKIKEVQEGKAVLVLYQWSGKPYRGNCTNLFVFGTSAVRDFICDLLKSDKYSRALHVIDSGLGVQKFHIMEYVDENEEERACYVIDDNAKIFLTTYELSKNDGLSEDDFRAWFKGYDTRKPLAIIHFTNFRY